MKRKNFILLLDYLHCCIAVFFAMWIVGVSPATTWFWWLSIALFQILSGLYFETHKSIWRYTGLTDVSKIVKASLVPNLLVVCVSTAFDLANPLKVFLIAWPFTVIFQTGFRLFARLPQSKSNREKSNIVIFGGGNAGEQIVRDLLKNPEVGNCIAILDDNSKKHGLSIHGIKIVGGLKELERLAEEGLVDRVVIAIPSAKAEEIRKIVNECLRVGVTFRSLPGSSFTVNDTVGLNNIREVDVDDLLGREEVVLNNEIISSMINGKCVLVTGAGGSIGSELCYQILKYNPRKIILFEFSEFALYEINRKLTEKFPEAEIVPFVGDIRIQSCLEQCFVAYSPQIAFHAAAYKHVTLMEQNPFEAIRTNVFGSRNVAQVCCENGVEKLVMVSTDKAVNPTSVMGCTKRIAELVGQRIQKSFQNTEIVFVRFGNVLESAGSVIPLFKEQISRGGPVTITHPDVTRYFMTIPEASQLVLQAGSLGNGGEIFVLEMGNSVRILDLAKDLIRLSGFIPEKDIAIKFIGLRTGEKLYEELLTEDELTIESSHKKLRIYKSSAIQENILSLVDGLYDLEGKNRGEIINELRRIVTEYHPTNFECLTSSFSKEVQT